MSNTTWSVFSCEYFIEVKKALVWKKHTRLFMGDLTETDLTTDSRFYNVEGKRRNSKFLGLVDDPKFPLKVPIKTYRNHE
jgi:hypothetical protein